MTVKELISQLQKYPNQNADINFITNVIDAENEAFDVQNCSIELFQQDVSDTESYDICVFKDKKQEEKTLHELLDDETKLSIELDCKNQYSNILITDGKDKVFRDIMVGGRHEMSENIVSILLRLL